MSTDKAQEISEFWKASLRMASDTMPRTLQSAEGRIGPSDLGFCRQKVVLMTKGTSQSDSTGFWPAMIGTSIHNEVEAALKAADPDLICGSIDKVTVTATFPCGAEITGTPDVIDPNLNGVLDIKTKDGVEGVKRNGASASDKYQRHTYVMGAIAAGLLDPTKPLYVGNVYLDRSGRNDQPHVELEEFDPALTDEINAWIEDTIYAVKNDEDASRDVVAPVCEVICEFFTVCRGAMPDHDGMLIDDPDAINAIDLYVAGRDMEKQGKRMKDEAKASLDGVSGSTGEFQVRWNHINGADVPGFYRSPSDRLDIRKVRKGGGA